MVNVRLYYSIMYNSINLIVERTDIPLHKKKVNIWQQYGAKKSFIETMEDIVEGGEEYMVELLYEAIEPAKHIKEQKSRRDQLIAEADQLSINVSISEEDWRLL